MKVFLVFISYWAGWLMGRQLPLSHPADAKPSDRSEARLITTVTGFRTPEALCFDAQTATYYVSNMDGGGLTTDNNGFITTLDTEGRIRQRRFIAGGQKGITLHAPKGLLIQGDTLWVVDIGVLHGFHKRTGQLLATIDFAALAPKLLNDVTLSPDGRFYVTDMGQEAHPDSAGRIRHTGPDRILRAQLGQVPSVVLETPSLTILDGIL